MHMFNVSTLIVLAKYQIAPSKAVVKFSLFEFVNVEQAFIGY